MSKQKTLICIKHNEVLAICEEILEFDFNKPFKTKLKRKIQKIIELVEGALEDGQNMENRLNDYYNAITEIGFERKKKKNKL